ncbi:MAG: single-stranded DNA-binding protein [Planctomycetota bacterium]
MANLNKVFLIGNLTRDPELRYTPGGTAIASFGIAVNREYTSKAKGERVKDTCFVDVDAWGKTAEVINQYMSKGRPIFIEGRLNFRQWEDKQTGQKRSKLNVVLESFQFLGGRGEGGSGSGGRGGEAGARRAPAGEPPADDEPPTDEPPPDDDIPF